MSDPIKKATMALTVSNEGGLDGLRLDVDYHGEFDPTCTAHNTIAYLAGLLVDQSNALREAAQPEPSRLILPEGAANV